MSRQVKILLGPPGTGKTTRLIELVKYHLDRGVQPERIAYCSFSKKAAEEAIARASLALGYDQKRFIYFRTLHSLAYMMLGLGTNQVMKREHFIELGNVLGLEFSERFSPNSMDTVPYFGKLGDKCLSIYSLARAKKIKIGDAWFCYTGRSAPQFKYVKDFVENLTKYKQKYDLYDFTDFLDECRVSLDVDVFILDEAQDLTRQQWDFAKAVAKNAKEVWIAGDDDQTIFQWAGADLRTFLNINGEREVLPVSYRLPKTIHKFCDDIVTQIKTRYPKTWKGRDEEGSIEYINDPQTVNLNNGQSWLLLCRHNYQLKDYIKMCVDQGVVYKTSDSAWSNESSKVRAVMAWEMLRKGKEISKKDYRSITKYTAKLDVTQKKPFYLKEDFKSIDFSQDWMDAFELMSVEDREYVRRLRHNKESLVDAGRIEISTIHGSKGGEAQNVLLVHDMSEQTYRNYLTEPDNEHRVFYVGASRTKENLFIANAATTRGYFRY